MADGGAASMAARDLMAPNAVVIPLESRDGRASPLPVAVKETSLEREAREEATGAAGRSDADRISPISLVLGAKFPSPANVPWPAVPAPRTDALGTGFRPANLPVSELVELAKQAPELTRFGPEFGVFGKDEVGRVTSITGEAFSRLTFTVEPVLWNPKPGLLLLLVPYRGSKGAVLAAFWELDGGAHRIAAAFALKDEPVPMALVYDPGKREELRWSACWNCPGGQGEIIVKDDGRIVIAQR